MLNDAHWGMMSLQKERKKKDTERSNNICKQVIVYLFHSLAMERNKDQLWRITVQRRLISTSPALHNTQFERKNLFRIIAPIQLRSAVSGE
jgi:hypothetical protein